MDPVERIRNMVRHTLVVKPKVTNQELLDRAAEIAPDVVEGLTLRQFHARYRLPIMRFEMGTKRPSQKAAKVAQEGLGAQPQIPAADNGAKPARRRKARRSSRKDLPAGVDVAVRDLLVEFAMQLEQAESRSQLVGVIAGIDRYVTRILEVTRGRNGASGNGPAPEA